MWIRLFPALVQGQGAVEEVCRGIDWFSRSDWAEVVIVARGGGSLEDLWTFNEEAVARAIADCRHPVVSAVGHETDVTIADFVADLRAPTPSAAAELVVPAREELLERVSNARGKAVQAIRYRLAMLDRRLRRQGIERALGLLHRRIGRGLQRADEIDYRMREAVRARIDARQRTRRGLEERLRRFDVRPRLSAGRRRLEAARMRLAQTLALRLARQRGALDRLSAKMSQLSPLLDSGAGIRHRVGQRRDRQAARRRARRFAHPRARGQRRVRRHGETKSFHTLMNFPAGRVYYIRLAPTSPLSAPHVCGAAAETRRARLAPRTSA